jgi:short-subunit dehydrogenase
MARGNAQATVITHDLAAGASAVELHNAMEAAIGPIDRLLIAHGVLPAKEASEANPDSVAQLYAVNVTSTVASMLAAAAAMRVRGHGEIIVVGSVAGDRGRPSNYLYGSSKAAVGAACDGLRMRLAGTGVRVMLVKPGLVRSPMTAGLPDSPLFAQPEDVAAAVDTGLRRGSGTVYAPWFWRPIMWVVRHAPEAIVRKL